jgi:hypothetical protein
VALVYAYANPIAKQAKEKAEEAGNGAADAIEESWENLWALKK